MPRLPGWLGSTGRPSASPQKRAAPSTSEVRQSISTAQRREWCISLPSGSLRYHGSAGRSAASVDKKHWQSSHLELLRTTDQRGVTGNSTLVIFRSVLRNACDQGKGNRFRATHCVRSRLTFSVAHGRDPCARFPSGARRGRGSFVTA